MKTQIIQLEPHDDTVSIKDKMGWSQAPRILLVWPDRGRILDRQIDLLLLKRQSTFLGSQLAFVTKDSGIRFNAEYLEIPVYRNIRKAEKSHWRSPKRQRRKKKGSSKDLSGIYIKNHSERRTKDEVVEFRDRAKPVSRKWIRHPITRLVFFTLGVLGVLAIAAVLVPSAEISFTPHIDWQEISFPVIASQDIDTIDFSGLVPIHTSSVTVEGRGQISTSGEVILPFSKAYGTVIFTNLTEQEVIIPEGTVISTSEDPAIRFETMEMIRAKIGESSEPVPIEAIEPGSESNIAPNQLNAIEGPLGLDLSVTNPAGIKNGKDQTVPIPSEKDYETIFSETLSKLFDAAIQEVKLGLEPGDILLESQREAYQINEEIYTPEQAEPADYLQLKLSTDFQTMRISHKDLKKLSEYYLLANMPKGYTELSSSNINVLNITKPELGDDGTYQWTIKASWQIKASIKEDDLIPFLLWDKPEHAIANLVNHFPLGEPVRIRLFPEWWTRLPVLPFRLEIISVD